MYKILLCVAAVLLPRVTAQVKPPVSVTPSPPPHAIPLTQIALRGEELARSLREISQGLPADSDLEALNEGLRAQEELVRDKTKDVQSAMTMGATLLEIREHLRQWRTLGATEEHQRKTLSDWGAACEKSLTFLESHRQVWEITLTAVRTLPQFKSMVTPVRSALTEIQSVKAVADRRLRTVLDLQARVSKQGSIIADNVERLNASRRDYQARVLTPDAPPIWQALPEEIEPIGAILDRSMSRLYSDALAFASEQKSGLIRAILFLVFVFAISRRARHAILQTGVQDEDTAQASRILWRPLSLAALAAAPAVAIASPLGRMSSALLLISLSLFPIARLLPLYLQTPRLVYLLTGFYALNGFVGVLDVDTVLRRWLLAFIVAAAICILAWWGRPAQLRRAALRDGNTRRDVAFIRGLLVVLVPMLGANVFGFLLLSYLLRFTLLLCSCFGLLLYTLVRVTTTMFAALLRVPRVRSLASVRLHERGLVRWTQRGLKLTAAFCWIYIALRLYESEDAAVQTITAVLNARPGVRAFNFSLGDVLGFLSVLIFGYLIARGFRFVLREEVLSHWRLSRGVPEAISTSMYYVALLLVFFLSLNAAGIALDKLTVLTGAVGVGLGFGMQNIVNNFVSGLILQFERPIRVGDVLEVGTLSGEIRSIGIRASTMRTFQGADVIIPNSAFISGQVVNWTLSEAVRRVDVPIHVAYGTDPERVIKMLTEIAASQAGVLRRPEPSAVFMGFGESSLEFLLMFWADQNTHFGLRSEVSIRISAALREAGIDIPLPQREIRVHSAEAQPAFRQSA